MEKTYQGLKSHFQLNLKRLTGRLVLSLAFWAVCSLPAQAQISIISDEETEQMLAKIIKPLFKQAGVTYRRNGFFIVNDDSLNAFVADGNNLFIHTGTIVKSDNYNELAGVIAHETGHIQGGHILRQKLKNQELQIATLASAIVAGTAAAVSGRGDAAMAVMLGTQSSALTHYTRYRTEEERSADEAAMKLLAATSQSPQGMLTFMKKISKENVMSGVEETPYFRTHPVTRERISFFENHISNDASYNSNPSLQEEFERVKAKLYAYLYSPAKTFQAYPASNTSIAAQYARSIAYFKKLDFKKALALLDELIAKEPQNPYFHELKGQIYLETAKISQAKAEYQKAVNLMPSSALLQSSLAQAILEDNPKPQEVRQAINLLQKANISRPMGFSWLLLSRAYGMSGDEANANYASAEYSFYIGARDIAKRQAEEAKKLSKNPKLSLKIDDLLNRLKDLQK